MVKSRMFHVFLREAFGCATKPSATILIKHSPVKITVKITSISSRNSLTAFVSPFGSGVKTAKDTQVPVIANRMKISNHFASVIVMQICRIGFFSLKRKMDLLARSGGGFTPGLLVGFFIVSDFSACGSPCWGGCWLLRGG